MRDLLPAAENCYKALGELPPYCLNAREGQKIVNRIKKYIDALETIYLNMKQKLASYPKFDDSLTKPKPKYKPNKNIHPYMNVNEYDEYINRAMDYIILESRWAATFPNQCNDRIRKVCQAVKENKPLPFSRQPDGWIYLGEYPHSHK